METILEVVQIAKLDGAVHGVVASWPKQDILHLGPAETFQANRKLPARDRFTDDREKRPTAGRKQHGAVELEDDTQIRTFVPARLCVPGFLNASRPVLKSSRSASTSMKKGSDRQPA